MDNSSQMYLRGESKRYFDYLDKMSTKEYRLKIRMEIEKVFNLINCIPEKTTKPIIRKGIFVRTIGAVKSPSGVRFGYILEDDMKEYEWKVGNGSIPIWLDQQIKFGRVKMNYNEDVNQLESVKVYSPNGSSIAEIGDSLILSKSGLSVLKKHKWQEPNKEVQEVKVEMNEEE